MFYFWGFGSAFAVYCTLSWLFPARETQINETIYDDGQILEAAQTPEVDGTEYDSSEEKNAEKIREREN